MESVKQDSDDVKVAGHTPGPWRAEQGLCQGEPQTFWDVKHGDSEYGIDIALCFSGLSPSAEANARLIAAAPDMLTALKQTLDYWDSCGFSDCDEGCECIVQSVQAAIAKAEGRSIDNRDVPEDENPREKGDDDGMEYGDPRDELRERSRQ